MVMLGLLLVLVALAVAAAVLLGTGGSTTLDTAGLSITDLNAATLFLAGAATLAVLLLGLWMMMKVWAHRRRTARARREVERSSAAEREELVAQKGELQQHLDEERKANLAARPQVMDDPRASHSGGPAGRAQDEVIDVRDSGHSDRPVRP